MSALSSAILDLLRLAEGLMPISAIHDRLPQDVRGTAQLTYQECQRLARDGAVAMEKIAGDRMACKLVAEAAAADVSAVAAAPAVGKTASDPEQPTPAVSPAKCGGSKFMLKAKGEETRLKILGLLRKSPWKSAELAKACGLQPANTLFHLSKMKAAGIVCIQGAGSNATWCLAKDSEPGAIAAVEHARKGKPIKHAPQKPSPKPCRSWSKTCARVRPSRAWI